MMQQRLFADETDSDAVIDGLYRYQLTRTWSQANPLVNFVMLNPSTADATADDPTIRRCLGFARRWGCGAIVVINLYARIATDPRILWHDGNSVGQDNDGWIRETAAVSDFIVCAGQYRCDRRPLPCGSANPLGVEQAALLLWSDVTA